MTEQTQRDLTSYLNPGNFHLLGSHLRKMGYLTISDLEEYLVGQGLASEESFSPMAPYPVSTRAQRWWPSR